ncbi:MAG: VWA domain-containing protein [Bryobacterales bacterium]|nr:VWA domain-containing protein [Bryobacterales bacterium]
MRLATIVLAGVLLFSVNGFAQPPEEGLDTIRVTVTEIMVPVTVQDRDGNTIHGLKPRQFRLYDNGKEQDIQVDATYFPLSMVLAIQGNGAVDAVLPQIKRVGSLIEANLIGEHGEAAVLAFDHRLRVMQDFTTEPGNISEAIKKINTGSSTSRLVDAAYEGIRMLRNRPRNRRKVLILIGETRDNGSEGRLREAMIDAQLANVSIYTVNVSRLVTTLTGEKVPPRPDPIHPTARSMPGNVPATPTTVMQKGNWDGNSANFIPLMVEIFRDVKAIFRDNPMEALTKSTGGQEFSFVKTRGLETAISQLGSEIHTQYIITYNPSNKEEGGFHEIRVTVDHPDARVRTRPGYWLATVN